MQTNSMAITMGTPYTYYVYITAYPRELLVVEMGAVSEKVVSEKILHN